ncbi:UNVERIFIED_CONTAM: hypothetical protein FKN15_013658 [Acipenser sinensis]
MQLSCIGVSLLIACVSAASSGGSAQRGGADGSRRRLHRVQHGQCSYTFVLPELENCRGAQDQYGSRNTLQRDAPSAENPLHKLQHLEHAMENNTQWLQKIDDMNSVRVLMDQGKPGDVLLGFWSCSFNAGSCDVLLGFWFCSSSTGSCDVLLGSLLTIAMQNSDS